MQRNQHTEYLRSNSVILSYKPSHIGADTLAFLSTKSLMLSGDRCEMCMACFDGNYPTDLYLTDDEATLYKRYEKRKAK